MKTILYSLMSIALAATAANASVLITFDQPLQSGTPGTSLAFMATLLNTGASTVFLNADDLTLAGNSFTVTDLFFSNAPFTLDPGVPVSGIELFDVLVNNPFTDPFNAFNGVYTLTGGVDGNAQDVLGTTSFSVTATPSTTTPEPSSAAMLAGAATLLLATRKRWSRSQPGVTR